ncbi:hypothetical protein LBMAG53_31660 [Planctomycetota bacterium]|nr:hypothetical protein LBMAG53_31660 [Planctomycetota bacterium]
MADLNLRLAVVVRTGRDGVLRGEALLVPGSFRVADSRSVLVPAVTEAAAKAIAEDLRNRDEPAEIQRFVVSGTPEVRWIAFTVPARAPHWTVPLALETPALVWHQSGHARAWLPATGTQVVVAEPSRLEAACAEEAVAYLDRSGQRESLEAVLDLAGDDDVAVVMVQAQILLPDERSDEDSAERELRAVADPVPGVATTGQEALIRECAGLLAGRRPRSVLLVGPSGAGKTALVGALAHQPGLLGERPIWSTNGGRLVAGQIGFGMWQARAERLRSMLVERRAILHVGSLDELAQTGRSSHNQTGVAEFMRGWIAQAAPPVVAECTPDELARLDADLPGVIQAFAVIPVPSASVEQTRAVLVAWRNAAQAEVTEAAIDAVVALHRRFAGLSAAPGRPLRFLVDAWDRHRPGGSGPAAGRSGPIDRDAVVAAFARATGLPALLVDDRVVFDPVAVRSWFAARVAGQLAAIDQVVSRLAVAKADLARRDRPLASLLFAGPTGVGKTELAKALAEFLYGDRGRLARFDLSEYADPWSALRLVGSAGGRMGLLVAQVRREPFSVILLDEIEKAHPLVFDLLLQALGEGRITDGSGRTADVRAAVVVMTSNLGAGDAVRGGIGFTATGASPWLAAVEGHFRPEFVNRLDAIIPFQALGAAAAATVVGNEIASLAGRSGLAGRNVSLRIDPSLVTALATIDPASGARGLKRRIETAIAMPVAAVLARAELAPGAVLAVEATGVRVASPGQPGVLAGESPATRCRRLLQRIDRCPTVQALRAERLRGRNRLNRLRRNRRAVPMAAKDIELLRFRTARLDGFVLGLEDDLAKAHAAEQDTGDPLPDGEARLAEIWRLEHAERDPDWAVLGIIADDPADALLFASIWKTVAEQRDSVVEVRRSERRGADDWTVSRPLEPQLSRHPGGQAIVLVVAGPMALPRWLTQAGVQRIIANGERRQVLLTVSWGAANAWRPPDWWGRKANDQLPARRVWNASERKLIWSARSPGRQQPGEQSRFWNGTDAQCRALWPDLIDGDFRQLLHAPLDEAAA